MTPPNISILLIMLCFWATLWLVNRFLIHPVNAVLDQRHQRVDGAQKEWAAKNDELLSATGRIEDELVEAARAAASTRETFRAEATQRKQQHIDAAKTEAEKKLECALGALNRDAKMAREELRRQAENLSRALVQRLLGREVLP